MTATCFFGLQSIHDNLLWIFGYYTENTQLPHGPEKKPLCRDHCAFRDTCLCLPLCCKISHWSMAVTLPSKILSPIQQGRVYSGKASLFSFFFSTPLSHLWIHTHPLLSVPLLPLKSFSISFHLSFIHSSVRKICKWSLILIKRPLWCRLYLIRKKTKTPP